MNLPSIARPVIADGWARGDLSKLTKPKTTSTKPATSSTNSTAPAPKSTSNTTSIASSNSTSAANSTKKARRQTTARRNTGFSNLPQIQADRVHAQGNKGKGIKIGIIDGGVDYTRTPMGGCFGPGCKVAGGYDFVGDNFVAGSQPVPDNDPIDKCNIHGTIVAGIIGANDNEYNVPGVAPEASLYMYRAFSCTGYTTEDVVFQAMQRAYLEDMDVLNMSLGEWMLLENWEGANEQNSSLDGRRLLWRSWRPDSSRPVSLSLLPPVTST